MWHPWRALAERAARKDLLTAASLDEVQEYQDAVQRIVGVAPMLPAQPMDAETPPNAPDWSQTPAWPANSIADSRLSSPRDNRRRW